MSALVAVRINPQMVNLYHRLQAKGKYKEVALVAVMRKLLVLAYGVLNSENRSMRITATPKLGMLFKTVSAPPPPLLMLAVLNLVSFLADPC